MKKHNKFMFVVAAAIAAAGMDDAEASDGGFGLQAAFGPEAERTKEGYLRTSQDYAIRIDRVVLDTDTIALAMKGDAGPTRRHEMSVGGVIELSQQNGPGRARVAREVLVEDDHMDMSLDGVFVEGRVFDVREGSERLPEDGVGISGRLPIAVRVKRDASGDELAMAVSFELPREFFEGIDWEAFEKGKLD